MNTSTTILFVVIVTFLIGLTNAAPIYGQHKMGLNISGSAALVEGSNDFGTDFGLSYTYRNVSITKGLYLYGSATVFFQPRSFEGEFTHPTDVVEYDRYRYGGGIGTGVYLKKGLIDAQLGVKLSRHYVRLNKVSGGMPPPASGPATPAPDHIFRSYTTLEGLLALSHDITQRFFIRSSMGIQSALGRDSESIYFRPALGLGIRL